MCIFIPSYTLTALQNLTKSTRDTLRRWKPQDYSQFSFQETKRQLTPLPEMSGFTPYSGLEFYPVAFYMAAPVPVELICLSWVEIPFLATAFIVSRLGKMVLNRIGPANRISGCCSYPWENKDHGRTEKIWYYQQQVTETVFYMDSPNCG